MPLSLQAAGVPVSHREPANAFWAENPEGRGPGNCCLTGQTTDFVSLAVFLVTIVDSNNTRNATNYLLQAITIQNVSVGEWSVPEQQNCSALTTAVLQNTQKTANWTSPATNLSSVEIR